MLVVIYLEPQLYCSDPRLVRLLQINGEARRVLVVTHKHACSWRGPADDICGQIILAGSQEGIPPLCVLHAKIDQPAEVALVAPCLVKKLVQQNLGEAAGSLAGHFGMALVSLNDLLRAYHPAES